MNDISTDKRTITVTSTASENVPADYVEIHVTAVKTDKAYKAATDGADALFEAVYTELAKLNADGMLDIRASGTGVNAVRDRDDGEIAGYRAQVAFSIAFDLDKKRLGDVMSVLGDSGCVWRLSYTLRSDETQSELVERAVRSARARANTIARAAGVKLGALVRAEYGEGGGAPVMYARAAGANDVAPENICVSETVACTFEIE